MTDQKTTGNLAVQEWRKRMRFMADIIFATAMTIMILNIELPDFGHISDTTELAAFLINQLNNMWTFFVAFVVIAIYWIKHLEHFGAVVIVNQGYIWFQLLYLGSIMLIPFWNTYISSYPDNAAIKVFLSANMVLVGVFSYLSLNYASNPKHQLVDESIPPKHIRDAKLQILTEPAIAILAAGLVFINIHLWDAAFILVPLLFAFRKKLTKIKYFNLSKLNKPDT